MLKETLKSIILSQQEWLVKEENEINREQTAIFKDLKPFTYILTGVRRSGKSTLLKQIMLQYSSTSYFNFEDSRASSFELNDFHTVEDLFSELFGDNKLMFFDEIQNVDGWERYIRDTSDRKKTIVLTGSNAKMLSRELGSKLTGRHLDYEVFPFSYSEFLTFKKKEANPESFMDFLTGGGFPGYLQMNKPELLSTLISDILIRDIFLRHNLRNHDTYKQIVQFLLSNTSKEVSSNNLKNTFDMGSPSSASDFLSYLTDAYLIFLIPLFDFSLKVQVRNPRKVYGIDQGLVNFASLSLSHDLGRLLENTVLIELKRRQLNVWYFKEKKECDFIVRTPSGKLHAIQVTLKLDYQNEKRETGGLLEAMEKLNISEGTIITYDQEDKISVNDKKIFLIPAWKWIQGSNYDD
jgi:uncharacterized protein